MTDPDFQDVVHALAPSPDFARDGICFAAQASGLYRSSDGCLTWRSAYDSLELSDDLATPSVALSPTFAADHTVFAGISGSILRSHDGGETWQASELPLPPPLVSCLAVSPNYEIDGVLFAGTMEDGVFRSADRGAHWMAWNFGLYDLHILALAISPNFEEDNTLFVGTETGVFRSTTNGRSWRELPFPDEWAPVLSLAVSSAYQFDGVLHAGTESCGLLKSTDGGETWTRLGEDVMTEAVNHIILAPSYPAIPHLLVLSSDGLFVSRDAGASWLAWPLGKLADEELMAVATPNGLEPGASLLVGMVDGRVLRTGTSLEKARRR